MNKTLYDILEVSRTASPEVIRAAYKSLVQRYHPDKNPDNPEAENLLKVINNAYETLSDPAKRTAYEIQLAADAMDEAASAKPAAAAETRAGETTTVDAWTGQEFSEIWETYQAYIGKNADYYQPHFRKLQQDSKAVPSLNFPAMVMGGVWAAYRKLYRIAGAYAVLVAVGALLSLLASPLIGTIGLALIVASWIGLGLFANVFYFRQAEEKVREISALISDPASRFKEAQIAGGVNAQAAGLFALLPLCAIVASMLFTQGGSEKKPVTAPPVAQKTEVPKIEAPEPSTLPAPESTLPAPQPSALPAPQAEQPPAVLPAPTPAPVPVPPLAKTPVKPESKAPAQVRPLPAVKPPVTQPSLANLAPPVVRPPAPAASKYSDLVTAVSFRDKVAVEKMIADGADVNLMKNNQFPLIVAVRNGDVDMVRLLLAKGADANVTDSTGSTPMMYAKIKADSRMIEILKNAGAKNPFE